MFLEVISILIYSGIIILAGTNVYIYRVKLQERSQLLTSLFYAFTLLNMLVLIALAVLIPLPGESMCEIGFDLVTYLRRVFNILIGATFCVTLVTLYMRVSSMIELIQRMKEFDIEGPKASFDLDKVMLRDQ